MNQLEIYRGLIITFPYGSLIRKGLKTVIVKSKKFSGLVGKRLLLIENKLGLGIIILGEAREISIREFENLRKEHLITEEDRISWWKKYSTLYTYKIREKQLFRRPVLLDYPPGPQVSIMPHHILIKKVLIGTSGYQYDGVYPDGIKDVLKYYSQYLNSVEINYTFYHRPTVGFVNHLLLYPLLYTIKVNQSITHFRQLQGIDEYWHQFYQTLAPLHHRIFCFLFQFSTKFKMTERNFQKLENLSSLLSSRHRYAFEFRDLSWFNDRLYKLFQENRWILVHSHLSNDDQWAGNLRSGWNPPLDSFLSDDLYLRLHGSKGQYLGSYSRETLKKIWLHLSQKRIRHATIYFNNTDSDSAWKNATYLFRYTNPINTSV